MNREHCTEEEDVLCESEAFHWRRLSAEDKKIVLRVNMELFLLDLASLLWNVSRKDFRRVLVSRVSKLRADDVETTLCLKVV